jgi:hypothetical protein
MMAASTNTAIRLVASPEADPQKAGRFTARLESTGELIVAGTRQPLADGARQLLARGFDLAMPLTMRHEESACDSFKPLPIGWWAKWTYKEGEKDALRRTPWMPLHADRGWQKGGVEAPAGTGGHPEANLLLRLDASALATIQTKDTGAAVGA